jgi:hypothetical protein
MDARKVSYFQFLRTRAFVLFESATSRKISNASLRAGLKVWVAALLVLVLTACAQGRESPSQPYKETTFSTGSAENAAKTFDSARIWLLTHGFGVLDKPSSRVIIYVMKDDQNISVVLTRHISKPTLVSIKVIERAGADFGPKSERTYIELGSVIGNKVKELLNTASPAQ